MEPLYSIMAQCLEARVSENMEWYDVWQEVLNTSLEYLPRGSGFDNYPVMDEDVSRADKLIFTGAYHAMDENGSYKGWVNYRVIVTPSFTGIKLTVQCVRDTSLREYIADCFNDALHHKHNRNEMIDTARKEVTS